MGLNGYQIGLQRDDQTVELVTRLRFMTADQVARSLFQGRRRVAARRLQRLVELERLKAQRLGGASGPMVYWAPPRGFSRAVREALAVSELYCRLTETRGPRTELQRFDVEVPHQRIRPDAVIVGAADGKAQAVLLEWDTGSTALERVGQKIPAYEAYAKSGEYRKTGWWKPGLEVAVVMAVPTIRQEPLTELWRRLSAALPPKVVTHNELLRNPWLIWKGELSAGNTRPTVPK